MKLTFKNILALGLLITSLQARAQEASANAAEQIAIGFKAQVDFNFKGEGDISNYTDKYNNVTSADVFFNSRLVKIVAYKNQPNCTLDVCAASAPAPTIDYLDVKFVERIGCYDSYHAKSRDLVSTQTVEKVIIHLFSKARCPNVTELPAASIYYKIYGVNNETGELGSAWLMAKLFNLQIVKL